MIGPQNVNFITTSETTSMKGVAFPVVSGTGGFFTRTEGTETLMSGLKQLILTNRGERVMMPDFGTNLRRSVFEPFTEVLKQELTEEITNAITKYEPRVVIKNLSVGDGSEGNALEQSRLIVSLRVAPVEDLLTVQTLDIIV